MFSSLHRNFSQAMTRRKKRRSLASARTGPGQHSYGNAVAATKCCSPSFSFSFLNSISFRLCFLTVLLVLALCATTVSAMEEAVDT